MEVAVLSVGRDIKTECGKIQCAVDLIDSLDLRSGRSVDSYKITMVLFAKTRKLNDLCFSKMKEPFRSPKKLNIWEGPIQTTHTLA